MVALLNKSFKPYNARTNIRFRLSMVIPKLFLPPERSDSRVLLAPLSLESLERRESGLFRPPASGTSLLGVTL